MEIEFTKYLEIISTMKHARTFLTSRQKMSHTGVELYDDLLESLGAVQPVKKPCQWCQTIDADHQNYCSWCGRKLRDKQPCIECGETTGHLFGCKTPKLDLYPSKSDKPCNCPAVESCPEYDGAGGCVLIR